MVDLDGGLSLSSEAPNDAGFLGHCSVKITDNTIMLIGGLTIDEEATNQTYFYSLSRLEWTLGPPLNQPRAGHSCGVLRGENGSPETVVVVGGENIDDINYFVEFLDIRRPSEFVAGPSLLRSQFHAQIVPDPLNRGILLIGGTNGVNNFKDIQHLPCMECPWQPHPTSLRVGRSAFVAFPIPDELATCT